MWGRSVRVVLTVAMVLGVLVGLPGTANANEPIRFEDHSIYISCFDPVLTNGTDFAAVTVGTSTAFGDSATLGYWRAPASPESDPPTLFSGEGGTVEATATHIEATIPLFEGDPGLPAGEATLVADLATDGDPFIGSTTRDGNFLFRDESIVQGLIVTAGTLTMPDGVTTFDLAGCVGADAQYKTFETAPDARVHDFRAFVLTCEIESEDGVLFLFGSTEGFVDIFFDSPAGALFPSGPGEGTFTTEAIDWSVPMVNETTGESLGDATVQATFTPTGQKVSFQPLNSTVRDKVTGDLYSVAGELSLPTTPATTFDLASCSAIDLRDRGVSTSPSGPKPGGPVPSNDLPSGAITLLPGRTINAQTRGASQEPEEPCFFDFGEGPFDLPIENTVWYRVTGTGQTMTVDTGGSDFDTIVGVYTLDGGAFTQIVCVDDIPVEPVGRSLQARVDLETVAGATYYVQVGGFQEGEPNPSSPFGRLRIRVS